MEFNNGDVWEVDGDEYTVVKYDHHPGMTFFSSDRSDMRSYAYYDDHLDEFKSLNPVLVRRRGQ